MKELLKKIKKEKKGQSLVEILVALAIGGLVIGAAVYTMSSVISSRSSNERREIAINLADGLMNEVRTIAEANWLDIYLLPHKTATSSYYPISSGTKLIIVEGKEGILSNEISSGLVGHWKFDENTGTIAYDSSGYGQHGNLFNNPTRTEGKISKALSFDGTDRYVRILSTSNLQVTGDLTINVLVYPTNCGVGRQGIIFKHYNNEYELILEPNCSVSFYQGDGAWEEIQEPSGFNAPQNTWTHLTVVRVAGNKRLYFYKNGELVGNDDYSKNPLSSNYPVIIGKRDGTSSYFNGLIDDVRIYNRALSSEEIQKLYNSFVYQRYFSVENVLRDALDNISSSGDEDPSTQKITVNVEWKVLNREAKLTNSDYLTRWKNKVFNQNDWSGGPGENNPLTIPNNRFYTSTNIDFSKPGVIKIKL